MLYLKLLEKYEICQTNYIFLVFLKKTMDKFWRKNHRQFKQRNKHLIQIVSVQKYVGQSSQKALYLINIQMVHRNQPCLKPLPEKKILLVCYSFLCKLRKTH